MDKQVNIPRHFPRSPRKLSLRVHSYKPRPAASARAISGPNISYNASSVCVCVHIGVCVCVCVCNYFSCSTAKSTNLWIPSLVASNPVSVHVSAAIISVARL